MDPGEYTKQVFLFKAESSDLQLLLSPSFAKCLQLGRWPYLSSTRQTDMACKHLGMNRVREVKKSSCGIKRSTSLAILRQIFASTSRLIFLMHHWTCPASVKCYFVCYTSTFSCPGPNQACLRIRGANGLSDYPLHHFETSHPPPSFQVIPLKIQFATKVPVR